MTLIVVCSCIYVPSQCMILLLEGVITFTFLPQHCRYDLRKYCFTNRVVAVWNSLPNDMMMADFNVFKNRLDKFWSSYDFVYLFRAQPLETGSVK